MHGNLVMCIDCVCAIFLCSDSDSDFIQIMFHDHGQKMPLFCELVHADLTTVKRKHLGLFSIKSNVKSVF